MRMFPEGRRVAKGDEAVNEQGVRLYVTDGTKPFYEGLLKAGANVISIQQQPTTSRSPTIPSYASKSGSEGLPPRPTVDAGGFAMVGGAYRKVY